jgi:deoxyribonuclease V
MYACIDVDYRLCVGTPTHEEGVAACVEFEHWSDGVGVAEHVRRIPEVAPYVPGRFFERELPCALAVLGDLAKPPELVIIDGYVHLDDQGRPGFGVHLWRALGEGTPVIGVAKNRFRSNASAVELLRGGSNRPLFVTAVGMEVEEAAQRIREMHGEHRLPTLLKRVDRLCRQGLSPTKGIAVLREKEA